MWDSHLFLFDAIQKEGERAAQKKKTDNQEKQNIKSQE